MTIIKKVAYSAILATVLFGSASALGAASADNSAIVNNKNLYELHTFAGKGEMGAIDDTLPLSTFRSPESLLIRKDGSLLVADSMNQVIRLIRGDRVTTFSGTTFTKDAAGLPEGGLLDGVADKTIYDNPMGIAQDGEGNVYVADYENNAIRKMDAQGNSTTFAGNGVNGNRDGKGTEAAFNHPRDVAVAADGTVYVADTLNHLIRKIDKDGNVSTLNALSQRVVEVFPGNIENAGDYADGALVDALFNEPSGLAIDAQGNLYVSDSGNQRIRYIDLQASTVTTVAGNSKAEDGKAIYESSDLYATGGFLDGTALEALFNYPLGIAITEEGGLLIADSLNHAIRYLIGGKLISLVGNEENSNGSQDGVASYATLQRPSDVAVAADGSIYIADSFNNKIRILSAYQLPSGVTKKADIQVVYGQQLIGFDAKPELVNYRTMVPVRAVTEAMQYQVNYGTDDTVSLEKDGKVIKFSFTSSTVTITDSDNSVTNQSLDAAPYKKDGRTYVPVRFFAETIGLDVQWDQQKQIVILRDKF